MVVTDFGATVIIETSDVFTTTAAYRALSSIGLIRELVNLVYTGHWSVHT